MRQLFFATLFLLGFSQTAAAAVINLEYTLDPNNIPTFWSHTPQGTATDYALGDTLVVEFSFGGQYINISDDDGISWITPWVIAENTGSHTIANATLGYRDLAGDIVNIPFVLAGATSSSWHLGGYKWENILGAGQDITLQSFVASFQVVNVGSLQQITGHYFSLNGVTVNEVGTVPVLPVPGPVPVALFGLALLVLGLRGFRGQVK